MSIQELVAGQFKIMCQADWAKNFPGTGRPPFLTGISFNDAFASIYEKWSIEHFEEGYRIRNNGTGFWAYARNGEVEGSSEFDATACKWYIESAGNGHFKILHPNEDLVWTVKTRESGYPKTLFLEPADGSNAQLFSFEKSD